MKNISVLTFSLVIICLSQHHLSYAWGWFSATNEDPPSYYENPSRNRAISNGVGDFSVEPLTDRKGVKLIENARQKLVSSNSCWQNAYRNLFAGCSEILADKEKQSRLAWHLTDCFQKDTGRSPFPSCDTRSSMMKCLKNLDESAHTIYLEFYLETNSICHQLQTDAFKQETERLVNDLKKTAQFAEEKLEDIEEKSEQLLHQSDQIQQSITSIDVKTQQVAQSSKYVGEQIDVVLNHSKEIFEQSKEIAASQSEFREGQAEMRSKLEAGMEMLHQSYQNLGQDIERLRGETMEIEKEINEVSNTMSLKMTTLQNKADDIGKVAGKSLDQQNQLLEGQSTALEGLEYLTKFQSQALEESRISLEKLAEFGHKQQEEFLHRQEQLQQAHDHLFENSKSIIEAQEAFESKQASMFMALDRLFMLHNAILLESRSIKAFLFYSFAIFVLYMFTSAKQTYHLRARLYLGLCAIFLVEFAMCRSWQVIDQHTWVQLVRSAYVVVACIQIAYSIFTYRDYEMLNHKMLKTLMEKINTMENRRHLSYEMESDDDDLDFSKWIDTDLPEDVNCFDDPDFFIPEEVAENSIRKSSCSRRYNFRPRLLC